MPRIIMLIPIGSNIGLTSIKLGLVYALKRRDIRLKVFKPINQSYNNCYLKDYTTTLFHKKTNFLPISDNSLKMNYVESLLSNNQKDLLIEEIINKYYLNARDAEIILIEGIKTTCKHYFAHDLNHEIANALNAEIVFVMSQNTSSIEQIIQNIKLVRSNFSRIKNNNILGIIFNKMNVLVNCDNLNKMQSNFFKVLDDFPKIRIDPIKLSKNSFLPILGIVPWNINLISIRAIDIAYHLNAKIINEGEIKTRRIKSVILCTCNISQIFKYFYTGVSLIISLDRTDIFIAACLAAINGIKIGSIILTDSNKIDSCFNKLYKKVFETGLPIFMVKTSIWKTFLNLKKINLKLTINDHERIIKTQEHIASYIDTNWIQSLTEVSKYNHQLRLSPSVFRYQLTELARQANKSVILPEGDEPRTIKAAVICTERNIATCILLGDPSKIKRIAESQDIHLNSKVKIIDPKVIRERYIHRLVELRKNKGMTEALAYEQLRDNVVLGTLMLEQNEVDGLVSGAIHTTANTIRPPLQLIKTAPGNSLISSIFFMLLPKEVYIYGDCAINPNPTAEQLAEIAIQSASSALIFGIDPRIAMLSYSTGTSGIGKDVEKVRKATYLVQKKRPDLLIDGPLQYDAAVIKNVAKSKAPNSPVAGRATVFIFPDLNTGNITYKAVQRSANLLSIGPILQGMRKPVNDLSRGAMIDDIVYTIAATAIQAAQQY